MIMNNQISKENWITKRWVKFVAILSILAFVTTFVIYFFAPGNSYDYYGARLSTGTRLANSALPALSYLFFLPVVILIAVLLREFFCWLFKINKTISLLEEIKAAHKETKG